MMAGQKAFWDFEERLGLVLFSVRLVATHFRQPRDAMSLYATMQGRAGQMRDCGMQGVKAIIERQQRVLSECNDDGLLFHRENC